MNNILNEVNDLKKMILNSKEYIDYNNNLKLVENNKEINNIVLNITNLQKEIVKLEHKKLNAKSKEIELEELYVKLNEYDTYREYIESSKNLNKLITNIQTNFQEFFDSLVS